MIFGYMQSIKQFADNLMSMDCMICLYTCLYIRFEALKGRLWVVHALIGSAFSSSSSTQERERDGLSSHDRTLGNGRRWEGRRAPLSATLLG